MNINRRLGASLIAFLALLSFASSSEADIYNWQSGETIPDTEGIVPGPRIDLSSWNSNDHNLRYADLQGRNLSSASFYQSWLDNARFAQANLANTDFRSTTLTDADLDRARLGGADLTDAIVTGVDFRGTTESGFTKEQLYSTASYKAQDLRGIHLGIGNDLTGWNFAGQNLANAQFSGTSYCCDQDDDDVLIPGANLTDADLSQANLTDVNFSNATLRGADLLDAVIVGARISTSSGFTKEQLYSTASYKMKDLTGVSLFGNLTDWDFAGQNLTNARLSLARLTDADLTDAIVAGADFEDSRGFSKEQLYSTASYKMKNLRGINLVDNNMTGWNFAGQNLTNASFGQAALTGADYTDAIVAGASFYRSALSDNQLYSTASYKMKNLRGINLVDNNMTGWNFAGQNLADTDFEQATLTDADLSQGNLAGANFQGTVLVNADLTEAVVTTADFSFADLSGTDFTNAIVGGADFEDTTSLGFTMEQLYSTTSYKTKDLQKIVLRNNDLTGWNFAGQNLANADIEQATLTGADLSGANLANANVTRITLTGADLSLADLRGASVDAGSLVVANTRNTILPDGSVTGLELSIDERLVIRNHELPVRVEESMRFADSATLELLFADAAWGSTIGVEPDVVPDLGGTLALNLDQNANIGDLVGVTFPLFDWQGQLSPGNQFDRLAIAPEHVWDVSQLYATGEVTLLAINYVTWHNIENPFDVDGLDGTSPLDALLVINELTDRVFSDPITGQLPLVGSPPPYLDVNNDGVVSPLDPLLVINELPSTSEALSSAVPEPKGVLPLALAALVVVAARRFKSLPSVKTWTTNSFVGTPSMRT